MTQKADSARNGLGRVAGRAALLIGLGVRLMLAGAGPVLAAEPTPTSPEPHPAVHVKPTELLGPPPTAPAPDSVAAPVYELKAADIEGVALDLEELRRHGPVLVDFWALWCKPCLKELPQLDRIHTAWSARGLGVVAINCDAPVDLAKVRPFVRSGRYHFRVLTDADGQIRRRFQINTMPTSLLLARDGRVLWTNQGYRPGDEKQLEKRLAEYLTPAAPDSAH